MSVVIRRLIDEWKRVLQSQLPEVPWCPAPRQLIQETMEELEGVLDVVEEVESTDNYHGRSGN